MVDVVVLNGASGVLEPEGHVQEGASLECCPFESPFILVGTIGNID